jgi:hypothetical protein
MALMDGRHQIVLTKQVSDEQKHLPLKLIPDCAGKSENGYPGSEAATTSKHGVPSSRASVSNGMISSI